MTRSDAVQTIARLIRIGMDTHFVYVDGKLVGAPSATAAVVEFVSREVDILLRDELHVGERKE